MANKNFQNYAVAGNNVALTYDNVNDTVTFDVNVDKNDVGLGNVDNTSDINKPISTLVQNALNLKEGTITAGTTAQYWRGDKTFQTLDKIAVGLNNVDNTSDLNKPISTATQTALNAKQDSIGYTPANAARTLTINGVTYDLTANRSWSVGDLVSTGAYSNPSWLTALAWGKITSTPTTISGYGITDGVSTGGSYANPTWLTSLAWGKITSTPTTLSGYGITDGVSTSGSYSNPSWITDLAFSKITGYSVPTLAQVTTAGATTTNAITVGGLTSSGNIVPSANNSYDFGSSSLRISNLYVTNGWSATLRMIGSSGPFYFANNGGTFIGGIYSTGNWVLQNGGTFTDAGFRLDVNGTARIQNQLTTTGSITAASAVARGVYMNQTLVAAANNDVLTALEINPTFTNGAFTGVTNNWINLIGNAAINGTNQIYIRRNNADVFFASSAETLVKSISTGSPLRFFIGATKVGEFSLTTGNFTLQNGGTFTDAGFRLDVNGTARIQNVLTLGSLSADPTGANGMIYYNTTSNVFRKYINGAWANL